mmetsp:Transcript_11710/g.24962  ORF Transcript_11710/g.24962 Transcript_11710/m.24962 type:complete len:281 (-) Transcript_11710:149-991(-)
MRKSIFLLSLCASASAWSPQPKPSRASFHTPQSRHEQSFDPARLSSVESPRSDAVAPRPEAVALASALPVLLFTPESASAATAFTNNAIPSALAAYGHYISLIGMVGCLMVERLTIKPNMSAEEEDLIAKADTAYGIFGALIAYTGYLRATAYEKGFDFYSHEPLFWLKVSFVGIVGAASFFNTVVIIQRAVGRRNGEFTPMGEKLSKRMIQICNAEVVGICTIPVTATFMARGVGYSQDFPWQVEAALAALVFGGLSFKYVKEAFSFEDNPIALDSSSD